MRHFAWSVFARAGCSPRHSPCCCSSRFSVDGDRRVRAQSARSSRRRRRCSPQRQFDLCRHRGRRETHHRAGNPPCPLAAGRECRCGDSPSPHSPRRGKRRRSRTDDPGWHRYEVRASVHNLLDVRAVVYGLRDHDGGSDSLVCAPVRRARRALSPTGLGPISTMRAPRRPGHCSAGATIRRPLPP